jgi:hypothetical protein
VIRTGRPEGGHRQQLDEKRRRAAGDATGGVDALIDGSHRAAAASQESK